MLPEVAPGGLASSVPILSECRRGVKQRNGIGGRDVWLDVMVGPADVAAASSQELNAVEYLLAHLKGCGEGKSLGVDGAKEGHVSPVLALEFGGRHGESV